MPRNNIQDRPAGGDPGVAFASYKDHPDAAIAGQCLNESGAVFGSRNRFENVEPGISVRDGMDRRNHEFFRPGEHIPRQKNLVILSADNIYRYNGIVHFVIDMMADFVTQGMQVYHPSKAKQRRYRHWWKKIKGHLVSERLVNLLFRHGVAVPRRRYGVLDPNDIKDLQRGVAKRRPSDNEADFERSLDPGRNRIPLQYTFLNPMMVEVLGGELALFTGDPQYGLKIPRDIIRAIKNPRGEHQERAVANLPMWITSVVRAGGDLIPLERDKVSVLFYKKDDWQLWSDPLILSIMRDIILYDKMKDADRAALDGSISRKTLWTLGLPEHKIQPGPASFRKLREQLLASVGGGSQDLIWDATLSFKESSTDVHKFLGAAKYEPVLQAIYAGLGIPQSLTGGSGAGGLTNNALSLKTLVERLTYARNVLVDFWEREFHQVQRAFGDRQPALLKFDLLSLSDEANEKQMWMNLWDRDLVSTETIREQFGMLPEIELRRVQAEYEARDGGRIPYKTGPFTEAAPHPDGLAKAAMLQGTVAPTEAGVKKQPKAKGDKSLLDHQAAQQDKTLDLQREQMEADQALQQRQQKIDEEQGQDLHAQKMAQNDDVHKQRLSQKDAEHKAALPIKTAALRESIKKKGAGGKGQPGQGRPKGTKDAAKRKPKVVNPRVAKASFPVVQAMAREAQRAIADAVTPSFLARCSKKNLRQLTATEAIALEDLKFAVLCRVGPGKEVDGPAIASLLEQAPPPAPEFSEALGRLVGEVYGDRGLTPGADELRELQASAYASVHTREDEDGPA